MFIGTPIKMTREVRENKTAALVKAAVLAAALRGMKLKEAEEKVEEGISETLSLRGAL